MNYPTQSELNMRDVQWLRQAEHQRTSKLGTGCLILGSSEDDVVIVQSDVEMLDTRAATAGAVPAEKLQCHCG